MNSDISYKDCVENCVFAKAVTEMDVKLDIQSARTNKKIGQPLFIWLIGGLFASFVLGFGLLYSGQVTMNNKIGANSERLAGIEMAIKMAVTDGQPHNTK